MTIKCFMIWETVITSIMTQLIRMTRFTLVNTWNGILYFIFWVPGSQDIDIPSLQLNISRMCCFTMTHNSAKLSVSNSALLDSREKVPEILPWKSSWTIHCKDNKILKYFLHGLTGKLHAEQKLELSLVFIILL